MRADALLLLKTIKIHVCILTQGLKEPVSTGLSQRCGSMESGFLTLKESEPLALAMLQLSTLSLNSLPPPFPGLHFSCSEGFQGGQRPSSSSNAINVKPSGTNVKTAWFPSAWLIQVQAEIFHRTLSKVVLINISCMKNLSVIMRD